MTDVDNAPLRYSRAELRNLRGVLASNGTIHNRIAKVARLVFAGTSHAIQEDL
jgi:hypothetical protein